MIDASTNIIHSNPQNSFFPRSTLRRNREIPNLLLGEETSLKNDFTLFSEDGMSFIGKIYLRALGKNEDIFKVLGLENWESEGNKSEACRRIINCFRKRESKLDLSHLGLTHLPLDLTFNWVKEIDLSYNKIQNLQPLTSFSHLNSLDVSYNRIGGETGIQDFSLLDRLENLKEVRLLYMEGDLRLLEDRLRSGLTHFQKIEWSDEWCEVKTFSRNPEELLVDFLRRKRRAFRPLPEPVSIQREIDWEALESFKKDPDQTPLYVQKLEEESHKKINIEALLSKDRNISLWLSRLLGNNSYTSPLIWTDPDVRPALARHVVELLSYAQENPEFFLDVFAPLISNSVTECGDRTLYYLNEMIRRLELFQSKDLPLEEALSVFKQYFPISIVKKIAQQSIQERGELLSSEEKHELEKEELEVELDFLTKLKDAFHLPLAFSQGKYTGTGQETRKEFLEKVPLMITDRLQSEEEWLSYLASDPDWQRILFKEVPFLKLKMHVQQLHRDQQMESLSLERDLTYLDKLSEIRNQFESERLSIFKTETKRLLNL